MYTAADAHGLNGAPVHSMNSFGVASSLSVSVPFGWDIDVRRGQGTTPSCATSMVFGLVQPPSPGY